jgi:hypothetical protein
VSKLQLEQGKEAAMNFGVAHQAVDTATALFELASRETATQAQYDQAVEHMLRDVLERYPDFSTELFAFAMGRAMGRLEGSQQRKRERRRSGLFFARLLSPSRPQDKRLD